MKGRDADLDRLLRSAARVPDGTAAEAPFGFDTRVVALSRAGNGRVREAAELTRYLRRIGIVALAVLTLASAAAYEQFNASEERLALQSDEYSIADSAIQTELSP